MAAVLIVVAGAVYYFQGGFNQAQVTKTLSTEITLAGKYYEGPARSAEFSQLFREAGQLVESGKLKGTLGGMYYNNPDQDKGTVKAFVGVVLQNPGVALPAALELRKWPANQPVLEAKVNAHYSLIPNKAYKALFDYAEKNNLKPKELYFEEYTSKNSGTVQVMLP